MDPRPKSAIAQLWSILVMILACTLAIWLTVKLIESIWVQLLIILGVAGLVVGVLGFLWLHFRRW